MQTSILNKAKIVKKNIAYSILGNYCKGAARESGAILSDNLTSKELGLFVWELSGENFDILDLKVDLEKFNSSPNRINYLKSMIDYASRKMDAVSESISASGLNETKKMNMLMNSSKKLAASLGKMAFSEGVVDEELKQDISLILKESKEKFIERHQNEMNKDAVEVREVEAPIDPRQEIEQGMGNPNQDQFGGDMGMDGFEEPNFQEEPSMQDLGFDQGFGDFNAEPQKDMGSVSNELKDIASGGIQGESYTLSDLAKNINELKAKGVGESDIILKTIFPYNDKQSYSESCVNLINGHLTTMNKKTLDEIVNKVLDVENEIFTKQARAEGVKAVNSGQYQIGSKHIVHQYIVGYAAANLLKL